MSPHTQIEKVFVDFYYNVLHGSDLWNWMEVTVEDSPYHREQNVRVHTDMVVSMYLVHTYNNDDMTWLCGALATAFHDVGKPAAEEVKYSEKRGKYRSYHKHALYSARYWEDYAVRNWHTITTYFPQFTPYDIYRVGWMIENHQPWNVTKKHKVANLLKTLYGMFETHAADTFVNVLRADAYGRIVDDKDEQEYKVESWVDKFLTFEQELGKDLTKFRNEDNRPVMVMPIAPSGAGKSTYWSQLDSSYVYYSFDDLRHRWYDPDDYENAFKRASMDNQFFDKAKDEFKKVVDKKQNVYVDNTNTSAKNRRFFIEEARNRGYRTVAVMFPSTIITIKNRQNTRDDKTVPTDAVENQYMGLSFPHYGLFDEVIVQDGNITSKD